jgi:aminobenzoyl-glutamate transport protein
MEDKDKINKSASGSGKKTIFLRILDIIEWLGNKLPDPFFLFLYMIIAVMICSYVFGGLTETFTVTSSTGKVVSTDVTVVNLLNAEYLRGLIVNMVKNYVGFAALGLVMLLMIGIGVSQYSGLFDTAMRSSLSNASPLLLSLILAFVGTNSSIASSAGIILSVTLGAAVYSAVGKNPIKGALIAYVSSHGNWDACIFPFGTDVLMSGITQTIAEGVGIDAPIHPLMNYYFMFVYAFVATFAVAFVAEKLVPECKYGEVKDLGVKKTITPEERRGLKFAGIAFLIFIVVMLFLTVPKNAFFRTPKGELLPSSPLLQGIVGILFIFFVVMGTAYGYGAGTIKSKNDIPKMMGYGIRDMIPFFIFSYTGSIAIRAFDESNLGTVMAVKGAKFLASMGWGTIMLAVGVIILTSLVNLFITAVNLKWMIIGPILVPMMATLGFSPALTAMLYRVGDSFSNPIAPVNLFLPLVAGVMNQYRKKDDPEIGIGTLYSMTIPYVLVGAVVHISLAVIWVYFDLPLGPGVKQMM